MRKDTKWVACWGNATSISDRTLASYAKDVTLRYPIVMCFSGSCLRFRFSNLTGTEPVTLEASLARMGEGKSILSDTSAEITAGGKSVITIAPGCELETDVLPYEVKARERLAVSIYLREATQMNAGVLITGPLSGGQFCYGEHRGSETFPIEQSRNTNWYYFLNTIDVLTEEKNHALICYGDSITAQSWPDYLQQRLWQSGIDNLSVIRRAVSGTRILRQYDCATYQAYGLKGATRFPIEMNTAGADAVLIQHGINDIIHPVGTEVNIFRPWSDLPTVEEMEEGVETLYIRHARELGLRVYGGTLLPIYGWRTYAPFREEMKNRFNEWLKTTELLDGCVDFDEAVRDSRQPERFRDGFDSGDHLHPSEAAYQAMAEAIPEEWLRS